MAKRLDQIPDSNAGLMDFAGTRVQIPTNTGYQTILHAITSAEDMDHIVVGTMARDKKFRNSLKAAGRIEDPSQGTPLPKALDKNLLALKKRLLSFGGRNVSFPKDGIEEDIFNILTYGQFWFGMGSRKMLGEPCQCHRNSSLLWDVNRKNTRICTGYALSDDGTWRQHSWVIHLKAASNKIVETTEERLAYFGFCMNKDQCEEFLYYNT